MNQTFARPWRSLSPTQWKERWETGQDLMRLLQWHRGDPKLTAWEEGFLTSIVRDLQRFHGTTSISAKQWEKIHQILDKLDAEPAEHSAEQEEQEEDTSDE